ncbi:hypothetical protein [Nocardia veterana]|uniref:Uncharacterized protein n=1 Tax=Nocardia veterana TaxID=132249 RepID=A0A7X6RJW9_9NOCA|nr:hypothetical protein [Nocardia veterana]NKY88702.1 hypothetical protein [Nocardia veterana]
MSILFGIGMAVWFTSVAAMFVARALQDRRAQAFQASLAACGIASVLLAITTPAVSGSSTTRNVVVSGVFVVLAFLCVGAIRILRRSTVERV